MQRFWTHVIEPLLEAAGASTVAEIGVDRGATTRLLLDRAKRVGGVVDAIDTAPAIDVAEWEAEHGAHLRFHQGRSHDVLARIDTPDAALVDGDHNWFTVTGELRLLAGTDGGEPPPLVIAHDVGWPYGRRDMYYDPDAIPDEHRHDAAREGVLPGEREIVPWGLNYWLCNARFEGGPRNGVLTAIEDFVGHSDERWELVTIEGFHGLGVLAAERRLAVSPALRDALAFLRSHEFGRKWGEVLELARVRAEIETWRLMGSPAG